MKTGDIKRYAVLKMRQQSFRPELPATVSAIFGGAKEHHSPSYPENGVGNIIEAWGRNQTSLEVKRGISNGKLLDKQAIP